MRKIFLNILPLLFITTFLHSQDLKELTIKVKAGNLPPNSTVYVSGNNSQMGNWNANGVPMDLMKNGMWEKSFKYEAGRKLEFKITRGSWATERVNDDGTVPANTVINLDKDTTISFAIHKWADQVENAGRGISGQITGNVEYIYGLKGKGIKPRNIIIWLPPGYDKDTTERYPVLYMQDGQNIIDPVTSAFGHDWRVDETADSLIRAGNLKKIIVVGIYNTGDRSSEYAPTDTGYSYMKFVVNDLKPLIDKKFRTLPDRNNTAVAGSSLGGLISFMLVWTYPNIFSSAACLSPAFDISRYDFVTPVKKYDGSKKPVRIYIDIGGTGLEKKLQRGVDEMLQVLISKGYDEGKDLEYFKDPAGEHNEVSWSERVWRPLEFMFGK